MIFLCYSREDYRAALKIERILHRNGFQVMRDPPMVEGDPFWRDKMAATMATCELMLVLWSTSAAKSPWVDEEIRAFTRGKRIFQSVDSGRVHHRCLDLAFLRGRDLNRSMFLSDICLKKEHGLSLKDLNENHGSRNIVAGPCSVIDAQKDRVSWERERRMGEETDRLSHFIRRWASRRRSVMPKDGIIELPEGSQLLRVPGTDAFLSAKPVTNAQYHQFTLETAYNVPPTWQAPEFNKPNLPVVGVSWFEARAYAIWAGGDLPSETNWELAAAAGSPGTQFATYDGNLNHELAHYCQPFGTGAPVTVEASGVNLCGFYGMCGNTWDWCIDQWGQHRVIRGGGYMDWPRFCRVDSRYRNSPLDRDCSVGLRICIDFKHKRMES